ncbi:MAG TPA: hypothetical protein RMH99_32320 [Sandaracinaceae bacterium LLY-WYZ-13_1]|nr:hypothetical protein [Sandaracinaceae bacterium LLY-WYZ-13_1]
MSEHLDEMALEALANDREDLVDEAALAHLDTCEACAERVALEAEAASDASVALRRAMPELDELDAMVARAMEKAPEDALDGALAVAPTRRSLWIGAGLGGLAATVLAILSAPRVGTLGGLGAAGRQLLTLGRAADRVVQSVMPGGWVALGLIGLVVALLLVVPMRWLLNGKPSRGAGLLTGTIAAALLAVVSGLASPAHAYRVEGAWPEPQPTVTLDVENVPTSEALRRAVEAAGLGVVVRLPDDPPVTLHVQEAPLDEVIEALLGDRDVVVRPGESLITVRDAPAGEAEPDGEETAEVDVETAAEEPPTEAVSSPGAPALVAGADEAEGQVDGVRAIRDEIEREIEREIRRDVGGALPEAPPAGVADRTTFGNGVEIGRDEQVRGVYTMGGDARVLGRAFGDVVTFGGDADIDGEVVGNVTTMGGDIALGERARVHGDLNAMGGDIERHEGAVVHGRVLSAREHESASDASCDTGHPGAEEGPSQDVLRSALWNVVLFLVGLVLLGVSRNRLVTLRSELAARPVRNAFGGLFGMLAGGVLIFVLTLTLIGLPGAIVLAGLLFAGYWLGWITAAWWLGSVLPLPLLKDRPVLQLAVGVAALFVVGLVPVLGDLILFVAALAGLGAVIATGFGKNRRRGRRPTHVPTGPFRTGAR